MARPSTTTTSRTWCRASIASIREFDGPYVEVPVFLASRVPSAPSIFIEPTIHGRIFVNDTAKEALDERIAANKISGVDFKRWDTSN